MDGDHILPNSFVELPAWMWWEAGLWRWWRHESGASGMDLQTELASALSRPLSEDAGRSWRSATRKETHTRDRIIRCLHRGLPGSRTLRNKRLRLEPQSATFLPAEAWTGTAAASVIIIYGDSKEKGALRCWTLGPGELHCLFDGRDPWMAAPFQGRPEPPTSWGVMFRVPGLQDPKAADLGITQQWTDKWRWGACPLWKPICWDTEGRGLWHHSPDSPAPSFSLVRNRIPASGQAGTVAALESWPGSPPLLGWVQAWDDAPPRPTFRLRRHWTAVFLRPGPGLHPGREGPLLVGSVGSRHLSALQKYLGLTTETKLSFTAQNILYNPVCSEERATLR